MKRNYSFAAFCAVFVVLLGGLTLASHAQTAGDKPAAAAAKKPDADSMNGYFLKDYADFWKNPEKWHFVTVRFRKDTGEMRLVYANDIAWEALQAKSADYPDGAVFAKIGLLTQEDASFTSSAVPSGARRYQLMIRDKNKWTETGGWGYALFDGFGKAKREDQDIEARACDACHALVPERGEVFSEPMHLEIGDKMATVIPAAAPPRVEFATIKFSRLPAKMQNGLPDGFKDARVVTGVLTKNLFRGTIDEIRPSLVKETLRSGLPAALVSDDSTLFSVMYVDRDDNACKITTDGKDGVLIKGLYTTADVPGQVSVAVATKSCEEKPQ